MVDDGKTTPIGVFKELKNSSAADMKYHGDFLKAYNEGVDQGALDTRKEILSLIQKKFMDPSIGRQDPEGKALLAIAREISNAAYTE